MAGSLTASQDGDYPPLPPPLKPNKQTKQSASIHFGARPFTVLDPEQMEEKPNATKPKDPSSDLPPNVRRPLKVTGLPLVKQMASTNDGKNNPLSGISTNTCPTPQNMLKSDIKKPNSQVTQESVQFQPLFHQNLEGKPCISFEIATKVELLSKLSHIVVCKFSHCRPRFQDFKKFLGSLKIVGEYKITNYDSKHVFVSFECFEDFVKLWMLKSCVIKGNKVRFFQWNGDFHPSIETAVAPIWVHLPNLPLYMYDERFVRSVASIFGNILYIEPANLRKEKIGCMSFCVAKDVRNKGPDAFTVIFEDKGVQVDSFDQEVRYGAIPDYCGACSHLGHKQEECKVAAPIHKRKHPVQRDSNDGKAQAEGLRRSSGNADTESGYDTNRPKHSTPPSKTEALNILHNYVVGCVSGASTSDDVSVGTKAPTKDENGGNHNGSCEDRTVQNGKKAMLEAPNHAGVLLIEVPTAEYAALNNMQGLNSEAIKITGGEANNRDKKTGPSNPNHVMPKCTATGQSAPAEIEISDALNGSNATASHAKDHTVSTQLPQAASCTNKTNISEAHVTPKNRGTAQTQSPSWYDTVEQNLAMDFSTPPFQNDDVLEDEGVEFKNTDDDVLVEDVDESSQEGGTDEEMEDSSEEEEDQSGDEGLILTKEQQIEKFEKTVEELSSIKSSRIITKKHASEHAERWTYSEEEEDERTTQGFNMDPILVGEGQIIRMSRLVESQAQLIYRRSVSPVGRPTTKLKNLKIKLGSLDFKDKSAILMLNDEYEKKQEAWITPKRRGRPSKKQNRSKANNKRTSKSIAQEPRKRGRPKKIVP